MSYLRDPDRKLRGVGSIASRDAVRRPARFGRRRALSGDASGLTECHLYQGGVYYIRRSSGRVDQVSEAEAKAVPACAGTPGGSVTAPTVSLTPTRTTTTKARQLPSFRPPATRTGTNLALQEAVNPKALPEVRRLPSYPVKSTGFSVQETMTPAQTAGGGKTSDGASRTGAASTSVGTKTGTSTTTKVPTPAASSSGATKTVIASGGGGGAGILTSPSVATQWVPPAESTTELVAVAPTPSPARPAITGKHLLYLGAGIGLLLLLARDTRD